MRWGLVPAWSKVPITKYSTFNAVIETVTEKPLYRGLWKDGRRCLIPVAGYCEWCSEDGMKQPFYIKAEDDSPLFLGGIWETWSGDETQLLSCSILTRPPIDELAHLHHRMPVIIRHDATEAWFAAEAEAAGEIAKSGVPQLAHYAVSRYVSNARNGGPQCIERIDRSEGKAEGRNR